MKRPKLLLYGGLAIVVSLLALWSCVKEFDGIGHVKTRYSRLTVEKAKALSESLMTDIATRSTIDNRIPFLIGEAAIWEWEQAEGSSTSGYSAVDIPLSNNHQYAVYRKQTNGTYSSVVAASKVVAVQDDHTGNVSFYVRISIPDATDDNAVNRTLNYDDRQNYNGLEYYVTLEGQPAGVVKYVNGKSVESVFLGSQHMSVQMRARIFASMMRGLCFARISGNTRSEMEYGHVGETFYDQFGNLYVYVDTNGDNIADAVTQIFDDDSAVYSDAPDNSGGGGGGGSSSDAGSGTGTGTGTGTNTGSGTSTGTGTGSGSNGGSSGAGGGSGGNSGTESGDSNTGTGSGDSNSGTPTDPEIKEGREDNAGDSESSGDSEYTPGQWTTNFSNISKFVPPFIERTKPYSDIANCKADPLFDMSNGICPTPKNGVKGGRFGTGRGRMHNGLDLIANSGTNAHAMFDGEIVQAIQDYQEGVLWDNYHSKKNAEPGNRICIKSTLANGQVVFIKYFHLATVNVSIGQIVNSGDIIGTTGSTGSASASDSGGPHLHIEVRLDSRMGPAQDPELYFYTNYDDNGQPIK